MNRTYWKDVSSENVMKHYKAFIYGFSSKADFKKDRTTSKRTAMLFNMGILVNIVEEFSNI